MEFKHKSVLLEETIDGLRVKPDGIYVVYNTWTKRVGNLDYESINFCCGNRYTVVKGGE